MALFGANFSMDRKHTKNHKALPIFVGGPMASILTLMFFETGSCTHVHRPAELLKGDLGSGKTSAYFFRRSNEGVVAVQELGPKTL